jgi:hypothetical protein
VDCIPTTSATSSTLDGRTYEKWSRTKIYEISEDGKAKVHSDTAGDVFKWVKIR